VGPAKQRGETFREARSPGPGRKTGRAKRVGALRVGSLDGGSNPPASIKGKPMAEEDKNRRVPRIRDRVRKPYEKPRILASERNEDVLSLSPLKAPVPPPKTG